MRELLISRVVGEIARPRPLVVVFTELRNHAAIVDNPMTGQRVYGLSIDIVSAIADRVWDSTGQRITEYANYSPCHGRFYEIPLTLPISFSDQKYDEPTYRARLTVDPVPL